MTERAPIAPLAIGPSNAAAALGLSWRETLSLARRLGVPVLASGERRVIPASALLAALERRPAVTAGEVEPDPESAVLRRLGRSA